MLLGKTLKHIRIFHHYSQVDLSSKLGLSRSYISEIESEKKVPTIEVLKKYSEFFKIPISNIMIFAESIGDKGGMNKKFKSLLTGAAVRFFDWICKDEEKK